MRNRFEKSSWLMLHKCRKHHHSCIAKPVCSWRHTLHLETGPKIVAFQKWTIDGYLRAQVSKCGTQLVSPFSPNGRGGENNVGDETSTWRSLDFNLRYAPVKQYRLARIKGGNLGMRSNDLAGVAQCFALRFDQAVICAKVVECWTFGM